MCQITKWNEKKSEEKCIFGVFHPRNQLDERKKGKLRSHTQTHNYWSHELGWNVSQCNNNDTNDKKPKQQKINQQNNENPKPKQPKQK